MLLNLLSAKQNSFKVTVAHQRINMLSNQRQKRLPSPHVVSSSLDNLLSLFTRCFRLQLVKPWVGRLCVSSRTALNTHAEIVTNPKQQVDPKSVMLKLRLRPQTAPPVLTYSQQKPGISSEGAKERCGETRLFIQVSL